MLFYSLSYWNSLQIVGGGGGINTSNDEIMDGQCGEWSLNEEPQGL